MKKDIPLSILKSLQPLVEQNSDLVEVIKSEDVLLYLKDKDKDSKFYFKLIRQEIRAGQLKYLFELKPKSSDDGAKMSSWCNMEQLKTQLSNWLSIIENYNSTPSFFDNPFIEEYRSKFLGDIKLVDEDADHTPFDWKKQLMLEEYLSDVNQQIEGFKEGKSEIEIKGLERIQKIIQNTVKKIPVLTKKKVVEKLAHIWAEIQAFSPELLKVALKTITSEAVKWLIH